MPPSTSRELYQYDVKCNFHVLRVVFHVSDLRYGDTAQHRSTTNSVGFTHEHDFKRSSLTLAQLCLL